MDAQVIFDMTSEVLSDYLEAAREAARRAAVVLDEIRRRKDGYGIREKGRFDFVTDADVAAQNAIRDFLLCRYPDHHFLGEESTAADEATRPGPDASPTWIVDPIDGTANFIHDCPFYCISIGLHLGGELVVGAILDPSRNELFSAAHGLGAWLNDQPMHASRVHRLEDALLAAGFPADMRGQERLLEWWRYFSLRTHSLRRTGSAALNLAYVAAGRFDGFWAFNTYPWDVAAGVVLVREAGGRLTKADGSPYDPFVPDMLASNGPLHPLLVECFRAGT